MHPGQGPGLSLHDLGEVDGSDTVTLLLSEIASHAHPWNASNQDATVQGPKGQLTAGGVGGISMYAAPSAMTPLQRERGSARGWQSAAQQLAALSHAQLLHRAARNLPAPQLNGSTSMTQRELHADPGVTGSRIGLRPTMAHDEPFLRAVYASTRADELALVDWDDQQKTAFVQMQFTAQHRYYHEQFVDAAYQIILCDGAPAGRLYLGRWPEEIRIIDIALLPDYRNRGIGSYLLEQILTEAAQTGKRVNIHVERNNPALRLYTRLGFRPIADQGVYLLMEWTPAT